jgi:kynurenine formamidase
MTRRWTQRPEGSNWGEFGDDDQLGSLNYIDAAAVRRGVGEVKDGRSFCLSLPLDYPGGRALAPVRFPPTLRPTERDGNDVFNLQVKSKTHFFCDVVCDDAVLMCTQYSTQWDSFAHVGSTFDLDGTGEQVGCFYNGYRAGIDVLSPAQRGDNYAMTLGIDKFAVKAIQSRGVMIDLEKHFGRAEKTVNFEELQNIIASDGIAVSPGDMLCIHTAFSDEILKMGREPDPEKIHHMCSALKGSDTQLHNWLSEKKISALCADNYAVERIDASPEAHVTHRLPLHQHCLFRRGIPLGELWFFTELAMYLRQQNRNSFLLTAPPLRLTGAVGSPVTPVATV